MQAAQGIRVRIAFTCRLENGAIYGFADRDTLEFVIGEGKLPALEKGVVGMNPGETRRIRVPASEANEYPCAPREEHAEEGLPAGIAAKIGYVFGPGDDGDVVLPAIPNIKTVVKTPPVTSDLFFDVEMLAVADAEGELQE